LWLDAQKRPARIYRAAIACAGPGVALAAEKPSVHPTLRETTSEDDGRVTLAEGFYYTELTMLSKNAYGKSYPERKKTAACYDTLSTFDYSL
jgi:hypothetical protein